MQFFNYSPLKGMKFQFMDQVMGFGHWQVPTSIDYDCICTILVGLVEDGPQARPTGIGMEL